MFSKKPDAGCDKYGTQRLELAIFTRDKILSKIKNPHFIENGTLLGAYRNQKFIPHDDDFDIGVLIDDRSQIDQIYQSVLLNLKSPYQARLVTSYASKIEIFDPTYGKYILLGERYNQSDFHYVTLDLQFYLKNNKEYKRLYYISRRQFVVDSNLITPTTEITLENETFEAPKETKLFLEIKYGSLNPEATYDKNLGIYVLN